MKCLFVNPILAACSLLLSVASYGQTSISSVPFTINSPGTYIVVNALVYSASTGNAITVNTDNVTIDLNGHYLTCPASGNGAHGIYANSKADIRIRNGEITNFYVAVWLDYQGTGTNLNFGNTIDTVGFYNNGFAVYCAKSTGCVVRNCIVIGVSNGGGIEFVDGTGNRATNNLASGLNYGFYSNGSDYFESNYADHCTTGFLVGSCKLRFNTTTNCTTGVSGGTSEFANDQ